MFSQIGCIMLIGLAAKNGILIVEFANQLRDRGIEFVEAVIEAAAIRLRPVLMTSLCTVFGAVPLLIASGAGAESRQAIGAVVVFGVMFSLLLTLYVVPVVYGYVARNTRSPEYIAHLIDKLRGGEEAGAGSRAEARPTAEHNKKPAGGDTLPALVPSVRFERNALAGGRRMRLRLVATSSPAAR